MTFYVKLFLLSIILALLCLVGKYLSNPSFINSFVFSSIIFFTILTALIHMLASRSIAGNNHRQFSTAIMAGLTFKLLASALFVLIYSLFKRPDTILVIIPFFLFYICFTILEVVEFMRLNKRFQKS